MFCIKCGNKLNERDKFCSVCGNKVEVVNNNINANNHVEEKKDVNNDNIINNSVNNNQVVEKEVIKNDNANYSNTNNNSQNAAKNDNIMIYKVLAYIGILFVIGMVVDEKDDKSLKFHVGQGMLVFFVDLLVVMVNSIVVRSVFGRQMFLWGVLPGSYELSIVGKIITCVLYLGALALSVIGIINVTKNEDKELPLIGSLAFYK